MKHATMSHTYSNIDIMEGKYGVTCVLKDYEQLVLML
jgi:hypothetical protein